jgi:hypothetical protein
MKQADRGATHHAGAPASIQAVVEVREPIIEEALREYFARRGQSVTKVEFRTKSSGPPDRPGESESTWVSASVTVLIPLVLRDKQDIPYIQKEDRNGHP